MNAQDQYRLSDEAMVAGVAFHISDERKQTLARMILGLAPAPRGLLPEMQARKVVYFHDLDIDNGAEVRLSPVVFSVFQQEIELLKARGFQQAESEGGDIRCNCTHCGFGRVAEIKYCQVTDGKLDLSIYRAFWLCPMCFHVTEQMLFGYEELTAEGAITAHTEGQHTGERIAPVLPATSGVSVTTTLSSSSSAITELYIDGAE